MIEEACWVAGEEVASSETRTVFNPYTGKSVGSVRLAGVPEVDRAVAKALGDEPLPTRHERSEILERARSLLERRKDDFARLITAESGLCLFETRHEVERTLDVLRFSSIRARCDDGEIFSCDIAPSGKRRKIFTLREPLSAVVAITPFNHPLNQVAHKLGPAIAVGTPVILKPSEKTPLTAIRFARLLYEAGLPARFLSVLLGETSTVAERLVRHEQVDLVAFTGSVAVGKAIAATAGYKRVLLELGGNDPLIILEDADLDLAARLACEGAFRNSGQRCTAVKRILVMDTVKDEFLSRFVELARQYRTGDPMDPDTRVGTVIDEAAARRLEQLIDRAVGAGANLVLGGKRTGAQMEPAIVDHVPRDAAMVVSEAFGPLAPVITVADFDDAIAVANSTAYGLSAGVVTNDLARATRAVQRLKTGTVNINEVPGYRLEWSPFGGVKDSGLGIKEGVIEAMKFMTTVKTFSIPW